MVFLISPSRAQSCSAVATGKISYRREVLRKYRQHRFTPPLLQSAAPALAEAIERLKPTQKLQDRTHLWILQEFERSRPAVKWLFVKIREELSSGSVRQVTRCYRSPQDCGGVFCLLPLGRSEPCFGARLAACRNSTSSSNSGC